MADDHEGLEAGEVEDFDQFRKDRDNRAKPGPRLRLFGTVHELPRQIPLAFKVLEERHRDREDFDALREVLTPLFGADALDTWAAKGMGHIDFATVLAWSSENMRNPGSVTLAEAEAAVRAEWDDEGKAPAAAGNREQRRAAAKKQGDKGRKKSGSGARS